MMNDERYVRKGYKIWDTYSDREVQELNYRSQSDYMCEVLNEKEAIIQRLELENENLRKQMKSFETTMNATSDYNAHLESKITTLEKENRELNSIKKFAEKNGINIFLIEEAFRKCWKDNGKLFEENNKLRQKIKHCVYVDVDNANGCMNCKYDKGSICSILNCGTHDYLEGVSECGLKYWECKDE